MEKKDEVIKVKGEKDEVVPIYKTAHGPVFAWGRGVATPRNSCREDYLLGMASLYEVMKAMSVQEFGGRN
jgi:acyl-homoserine lactone acylase PvdQ